MAIIYVRVDDRLIHGQVANLWTTKLQATRIMVIDDAVAQNEVEKVALKMAVPAGVKLSVLPAEKAAQNILAGKYDSQRVFIVVRDVAMLVELAKAGVPLPEINVGNLAKRENTKQVLKSVCITPEEVTLLRWLKEQGSKLIAQKVPNEEKVDFEQILAGL
ncbi:PTS system mannose/fructose/N-acetylgalactosamine-transporter subunit IIB [Listeria ilorinensis]|uniref:PTS system mannose/fructose/N-acetylgalactosamine-transporter subunit IIB n=1 Tax=Listeria ilorinensis TaxID=2867439 RepID=UPI001EF43072|nr:PTS sugar transporter subunit IIB [Listeria ilorinensis]